MAYATGCFSPPLRLVRLLLELLPPPTTSSTLPLPIKNKSPRTSRAHHRQDGDMTSPSTTAVTITTPPTDSNSSVHEVSCCNDDSTSRGGDAAIGASITVEEAGERTSADATGGNGDKGSNINNRRDTRRGDRDYGWENRVVGGDESEAGGGSSGDGNRRPEQRSRATGDGVRQQEVTDVWWLTGKNTGKCRVFIDYFHPDLYARMLKEHVFPCFPISLLTGDEPCQRPWPSCTLC